LPHPQLVCDCLLSPRLAADLLLSSTLPHPQDVCDRRLRFYPARSYYVIAFFRHNLPLTSFRLSI
jgi:hypothetical protein